MRNFMGFLLALLLICFSAFAIVDQVLAQNDKTQATTASALREVESAAEAFIKAFNNLDWDLFRNSFADDATVFFPSALMAAGRANVRTEIETIFKPLFDSGRKQKDSPPYLNIEPKEMRIKMLRDAAVVTFHLGVGTTILTLTLSFALYTSQMLRGGRFWHSLSC